MWGGSPLPPILIRCNWPARLSVSDVDVSGEQPFWTEVWLPERRWHFFVAHSWLGQAWWMEPQRLCHLANWTHECWPPQGWVTYDLTRAGGSNPRSFSKFHTLTRQSELHFFWLFKRFCGTCQIIPVIAQPMHPGREIHIPWRRAANFVSLDRGDGKHRRGWNRSLMSSLQSVEKSGFPLSVDPQKTFLIAVCVFSGTKHHGAEPNYAVQIRTRSSQTNGIWRPRWQWALKWIVDFGLKLSPKSQKVVAKSWWSLRHSPPGLPKPGQVLRSDLRVLGVFSGHPPADS